MKVGTKVVCISLRRSTYGMRGEVVAFKPGTAFPLIVNFNGDTWPMKLSELEEL